MLTRNREDFQRIRIKTDNRLGRTAKGKPQNQETLTPRFMRAEEAVVFTEIADDMRNREKEMEKELLNILPEMPIYDAFLKDIPGLGTVTAGHICGHFDIFEAEAVSNLWAFAGLSSHLVHGIKVNAKTGKRYVTEELVRADKLTPTFVSPFNKQLRIALCGVMADCFIKAQNKYALDFYYPYKHRLENSDKEVMENGKMVAWKNAAKGHRHRAAIRYMVKMFLADLYAAWRPLHGLAVRAPYQEEYLGHKHNKKVA